MALFRNFGERDHRTFDHKPIYYDPEKEKRRRYFGAVDGTDKSEDYVPGRMFHGSFRRGERLETKSSPMKTVQRIISIVTIVLVVAVLLFILKLYPYLFK